MLDRLKLLSVILFCESVATAGLLALDNGARVKGASFFGYGGLHFLLLVVLIGLAVIFAVTLFLLMSRASFRTRWVAWFSALKNNPQRYQRVVLTSLLGVILANLLLLFGYFFLGDHGSNGMLLLPAAVFMDLAWLESFVLLAVNPNFVEKRAWLGKGVLLILLGALMLGYLQGALDFSKWVNRTPNQVASDQLASMGMIAAAHQHPLTYIGDGQRMPLFSTIEGTFYNPQMTYLDSFNRAKTVAIYLSILLLAGLFVFFQKTWKSLFTTVNMVLIAAYAVFIFKSAIVLPELLFYFFGFLSFAYLALLFVRPSYKSAILAGIFTYLAYLSKATVLASLTFFVVIWCFAIVTGWLGRSQAKRVNEETRPGDENSQPGEQEKAVATNQDGAIVLKPAKLILIAGTAVAVFLGLLIPFGVQNIQKYGSFFSNLHSGVMLWTDSWSQFMAIAKKYGGVTNLLMSPDPGKPSLQNYIRTHSLQQALQRFSQGFNFQLYNITNPYNSVNYPLVLLVTLLVIAAIYYKRTLQLLIRYKALILFVLSYFLGYFVLFCWFGVIDKGPRFILGLFLPLLFSIYAALFQYRDKLLLGIKRLSVVSAINVMLLVMVCVDAYIVLNFYLLAGQYGF